MCRILATEVHRRLISDCNGRDPRSGAASSLRRFGLALVPRLPVLGGYPAATRHGSRRPVLAQTAATPQASTSGFWVILQENVPEFVAPPRFWAVFPPRCRGSRRPVLAQTARPPPGVDPPGSGLFCKKMGPNLTLFRGSGRLYRRSEAFTSSVPRSAAYETAQTFARALANAQVPLHAAGLRNRPGLCLAFQATNQTVGRAACETVENLARALCRTSDRAKNGEMGIRNRPELHSGVRPPSAG